MAPLAVVAPSQFCIIHQDHDALWFHLLAGLGSATLATVPVLHTTFPHIVDIPRYDTALQIYSLSIRASHGLRQHLHRPGAVEALVVSISQLFGFEMAIGNHMSSLRWLRYLRAIMQTYPVEWAKINVQGRPLHGSLQGHPGAIRDDTLPHMADLKAVHLRSNKEKLAGLVRHKLERRTISASLDEASAYLEVLLDSKREIEIELLRSADHCVQDMMQRHPSLDRSLSPLQHQCLRLCISRVANIDPVLSRQIEDVVSGCYSWLAIFDEVLREQQSHSAAASFLQLRAVCTRLSLETYRETKEMALDEFMRDFQQALGLAEQYLKLRHPVQSQPIGPRQQEPHSRTRIFEWGILPALYMICAKCRDPMVRRRARTLLVEARRRESSLESGTLAMYAELIVRFEEARAGAGNVSSEAFAFPGLFASCIPESARFSDIMVSTRISDDDMFDIVFARFAHERNGEIELFQCACSMHAIKNDPMSVPPNLAGQGITISIPLSQKPVQQSHQVQDAYDSVLRGLSVPVSAPEWSSLQA